MERLRAGSQGRWQRGAAGLVGLLGVLGVGDALAAPKVCGNQAALGDFTLGRCPELRDDGMPPDVAAGDGIYSLAVTLTPTSLLKYKLLPSGAWDGSELGLTTECSAAGDRTNGTRDVQIADPDTSQPVRFYLDTRELSGDPSYARPPRGKSFGDDLMVRTPGARCPTWQVIGDFQNVPFDKTVGAVTLGLDRPGVLVGRVVATKNLAAGWQWKVVDKDAAPGRRFGPGGWAYEPCDADNVSVPSSVRPGDILYFTFYASLGRLQTRVVTSEPDAGTATGGPLCPTPPPDLASSPAGDLAGPAETGDLAGGPPGDGGGSADLGPWGPLGPRPGIHCDCSLAARPLAPPGAPAWASGLIFLGVVLVRRVRRALGSGRR